MKKMRPTVESVLSTIYMSVPVVIVTNNDSRKVDLTGRVTTQDVEDGLNQDIFEDYYVANIDFDSEALCITASPYDNDEDDIYFVD
jgi:hypothetical protein